MPTRLIELVDLLPSRRVVLVGDLMLDRYLYGNAERLSPEAPVPVLHIRREEYRLGGAASVAANLATLGAKVSVVGVIGSDPAGEQLLAQLADLGVDTSAVLRCTDRPTTCKTRLVGLAQHRHPQQMMRLDFEENAPIPPHVSADLLQRYRALLASADVVCLEDYNKGVLHDSLTADLIHAAAHAKVPVIVDPAAIRDYRKYAGATCLKLNRTETEKATGLPLQSPEHYAPAAEKLLVELGLEAAVVTLDKHGAYLATRDGTRQHLTTRQRQVYDVTGAGDMVLAALSLARAAGATWPEAVALANVAGGLEVEKFGAVPITATEMVAELLSEAHALTGKLRDETRLLAELQRHRQSGKRIVFTNGCFDLLHLGHVQYFRFAKRQGDLLVVAVNTDASIRRLKGDKRPVVSEDDRVSVLEELESIDYLLKFSEDTPQRLIELIRPDVLVKGADYTKDKIVGADFVESTGGRVALAPLVDGRSTTNLISRILDAYSPPPPIPPPIPPLIPPPVLPPPPSK
jgi:D-beta-D-heptose 7-phosphate kinase / D-beta-D-heptose 1-phosphate adenosyltransferase